MPSLAMRSIAAMALSSFLPLWSGAWAEAPEEQECFNRVSADNSDMTAAAYRRYERESLRCFQLPSLDVRQECANDALAAYSQSLAKIKAEFRAQIEECRR